MNITLPKRLNSLQSELVIPIELNDTDIDRMLTRVLEMAVKGGRNASSKVDAKAYDTYLDRLASNAHIHGFDNDRGRAVLDGWIRSSILIEERAGLRRDSVQMGYLRPLTIASYRTGLPKTASRNRKADALTYQAMEHHVRSRGSANPVKEITQLFLDTFGRGVDVGVSPWSSPRYDERSPVDIDTLLALRFIEGFQASEKNTSARAPLDPSIPLAINPIGHDLVDFLEYYGPAMPVSEAYLHFSALLSLRLFQLPLVSARVVRALLSGAEPPEGNNPSELYVDFVRRRGSASDELSYQAVTRDLELLRGFFRDRLLLRSIHENLDAVEPTPDLGDTAYERLRSLAAMRTHGDIGAELRRELRDIQRDTEDEDALTFIEGVRQSPVSHDERFIQVLVEALRKRGLENQVKWFHNSGGLAKPYGILSGTLRARTTWRYAPTDEALTSLLCLCFVENGKTVAKLSIQQVLERLNHRFGIVIDRPPADLDSADARAGAAENLTAFTQRLKLLGCFQGLSDDFNAQFVTRPREATR